MVSRAGSPTKRPIGTAGEVDGTGVAIPWIDAHQHTQSLTWNDREAFDLSGGQAIVMIAASYYWSPYRPVAANDVRFLWDDALRRAHTFSRTHFYEQYVAVGIHTWSRVEDPEDLLAVLPDYCDRDEVVAVGETGIESTQHTAPWPLDGQRKIVREQMHVAAEEGLPFVLHTPGSSKGGMSHRDAARYEEADASFTEPVLDGDDTKLRATEISLDLKDEAGLDDERLIVDHADESIVPEVLETTDCYLGFSIGAPWMRGVDAGTVAAVVEEYGPERVIVDTDLHGAMRSDAFAMKRTVLDLLRLGLDEAAVRQVVYDNPGRVLGLDTGT